MKIAVCGCSFSAKIDGEYAGTHWSELLADMLGAELISYARQGISNAAIRVQIDEAIKDQADLVLIGATTEDRIEFPLKKFVKVNDGNPGYVTYPENQNGYIKELGIKNFNYGHKHPYRMISETIFSVIDKDFNHNYRVEKVSNDIRMAVEGYAAFLYDGYWKKQCDRWILNSGLWELHARNIRFLYNPWFIGHPGEYDVPNWFSENYFLDHTAGFITVHNQFPANPDPGYHITPEGQKYLANLYYKKIKEKYGENINS